jgi:hypothetical protein
MAINFAPDLSHVCRFRRAGDCAGIDRHGGRPGNGGNAESADERRRSKKHAHEMFLLIDGEARPRPNAEGQHIRFHATLSEPLFRTPIATAAAIKGTAGGAKNRTCPLS